MQTLNLTLDDSIYQKVLDFLNTLPKNSVKIDMSDTQKVDLSQFNIQGLKQIENPVIWQKNQRDEW